MAADPLGLRDLPQASPPAGLWPAIANQLDAEVETTTSLDHAWWRTPVIKASAATVLLAFLGLFLSPAPVQPTRDTDLVASNPAAVDRSAQIDRLRAVSSALESQLSGWQEGVTSAGDADVIARMQQQLSWLDVQLEQSPDDALLWAERVTLLSEMNQQYASTDWRNDLGLASY